MKKLTILLLLISVCSFGQITLTPNVLYNDLSDVPLSGSVETSGTLYSDGSSNEQLPSGRKYIISWKGNEYPTIVYYHGSGQIGRTLDAIRGTPFYKKFFLANRDKYNFFMPLQYAGKSGWEDKSSVNGVSKTSGAWFILDIIERHEVKNIVATGHSAGATWELGVSLQKVLSGFAPVAGSALSYSGVKLMGANKIPISAWHGTNDNGRDNNITEGRQAVSWYNQGGGSTKLNELPGVGHGSDSYVYIDNGPLELWIDSLFPPIVIEKPGIYVDGVWIGENPATFEGHTIEYKP